MTKGTIMLGKGRYVQSMIGLAAEVVIEAMKDLGGEYIILAVPLDEYEAREKEDKRKLCDFCVHTHIPGELCVEDRGSEEET